MKAEFLISAGPNFVPAAPVQNLYTISLFTVADPVVTGSFCRRKGRSVLARVGLAAGPTSPPNNGQISRVIETQYVGGTRATRGCVHANVTILC